MISRRLLAFVTLALIVSPFQAASAQTVSVGFAQRELLLFVNLAPTSGPTKAFYEATEIAAEGAAKLVLTPRYRRIHVVRGSQATLTELRRALDRIAANRFCRAVDCILVTHGLSSRLSMADGLHRMSDVETELQRITPARRAKLRMMFSTACFGASHRSAWRRVGFKCVSGSRKVYADSVASYIPFLLSWGGGSTFRTAVDMANTADMLRFWDGVASSIFFFSGNALWTEIDSFRARSGFTSLRINTQRLGLL